MRKTFFALLLLPVLSAAAQVDAAVPTVPTLLTRPTSELADAVNRFSSDVQTLRARYDADASPAQRGRMRKFYDGWRARLREMDFDKLSQEGRVDYVLLDNYLQHQLALLDRSDKLRAEAAPLVPFADRLLALQDSRRNLDTVNHAGVARILADVARNVDSLRTLFETPARGANATAAATPDTGKPRPVAPKVSRTVANRAAD